MSANEPKVRELCTKHYVEYIQDFGDDGGAFESTDGTCHYCERWHQSGCICADCSGAELTADND